MKESNETNEILKILKNQNAKATFFLVGEQIEKYPELKSQIEKNNYCLL